MSTSSKVKRAVRISLPPSLHRQRGKSRVGDIMAERAVKSGRKVVRVTSSGSKILTEDDFK